MVENAHEVVVEWLHHRRASLKEEEAARRAAFEVLSLGKSPEEAAIILLEKLFLGRPRLFGGVRVTIDGEKFE